MHLLRSRFLALAALAPFCLGSVARAQSVLDQAQHLPVTPPLAAPGEGTEAPRLELETNRQSQSDGHSVFVGGIALTGLQALSPADFADILASRVSRTLSPDELEALATAIAARAREKGYVFAAAWIEPQQLDTGVLVVCVDEGRIDEIEIEGHQDRAIQAALAPLQTGKPVTLAELERRLLLAGDLGGVRISSSRFVRRQGKGVLVLKASFDKVSGYAMVANEGTRPLGPLQATMQAEVHALITAGDSFWLTWSGTPTEPGELQFARLHYEKRISASGADLSVNASYAHAAPGSYLTAEDLRSRNWMVGLALSQPLLRRRNTSFWLQLELMMQDLSQDRQGVLVRSERVVTGRASVNGYGNVLGGRLRGGVSLTQGLGILGADGGINPLASRAGSDGTFTILGGWADWTLSLTDLISIRLASQGQLSSQSLPVSQEMGLGGSVMLRGYDWFERSGDDGIAGSAELRYTVDHPFGLARKAQFYTFVDGGVVANHDPNQPGGSLFTAGTGVRADVTKTLGANFELAFPLSGLRYDTGNQSPKLNFRVQKSF